VEGPFRWRRLCHGPGVTGAVILKGVNARRIFRSIDERLVGFGLVVLLAGSVGVIARASHQERSVTTANSSLTIPLASPAQLSVTVLRGTPLVFPPLITNLAGHGPIQMAPLAPPPGSLLPAPPGTYPVWPVGRTATPPAYRTATDVVRDFATRALGIPNPTVTEPGSVSTAGFGTVTIGLPAGHRDLDVLTQRQVDGNWQVTQVGDQRYLEGITLLPGGKPRPVMTIHPPAGAATADATEVAADGIHDLHLTAEDLQAGVVHLAVGGDPSATARGPIHTILIVYRNSANGAIEAIGDEFG
jgi:hypothetical protein